MKTILVPTDFSDYALYALKVAASIARKINARIKLVHVYNLPSSGVSQFSYYENFFNEVRTNAEQQLDTLIYSPFMKNIPVEKHLMTDKLMWEMVTDDKFRNSDLIVMGSHGKSGFNKVLIGSNTEKVVRMADAPVLTIKKEYKKFNIKKIVFACDYNDKNCNVFKKIKFLINAFHPELHLLKVITPSSFESTPESMDSFHAFTRKYGLRNTTVNIYNHRSIETGIIKFSEAVKADLIIIPTHGSTGIAHLINGSLAESLVKHEPKPILSIKIPASNENKSTILNAQINYENWGEG
jgi:nucleotide-binding universal stress UspA family protein